MAAIYEHAGQKTALARDLKDNPLGTEAGENFTVPVNYRIPIARIYVVNHSLTRVRKRILEAVSYRRGAEEALMRNKDKAKVYNAELLYKRVEQGHDMNEYETGVFPQNVKIRVGQEEKVIRHAKDKETPPPRIEVKEGAWDLYLGNYERMRSDDPRTVGEERSKLAQAWSRKINPVLSFTDDGVTTERSNPFGFLEFIRIPVTAEQEVFDREYLTSLDLVEA